MIRIRRIPPRGLLRRPRYEAEIVDERVSRTVWQGETTSPATTIDTFIGIPEAWALKAAADQAWTRGSSEWITFPYAPH